MSRNPRSAPVADDPRVLPNASPDDKGGLPLTEPWERTGFTHTARFLRLKLSTETQDKIRALSPMEREEKVARLLRWRSDKLIPHDKPTMGRIFAEDLKVILALLDGDKRSLIGSRGPTLHETAERKVAKESDRCSRCGMPEPGWTEGEAPDKSMELSGCAHCGKSYWKMPSSAPSPKGADWLDPAKHPPTEPVTVGGPTGDLKPEVARKTYPPSNPRHPEHQIWLEQEAKRRKKSVAVLKAAEEKRRQEQAAKKGGK